MFFCSVMSLIVSVILLLLMLDDLYTRKTLVRADLAMDAVFIVGFICTVILSVYSLLSYFH